MIGSKKYMTGVLAVAAALLLCAARPARANLLVNGNFSSISSSVTSDASGSSSLASNPWPTGWNVSGGTTGIGSTWYFGIHTGDVGTPGNPGDNAMEALATTSVGTISQSFATVTGQEYSFSYVYNSGDTNPSVFTINISNAGTFNPALPSGSASLTPGGWVAESFTFIATDGISTLSIQMQDEFSNVEIGDLDIEALGGAGPSISSSSTVPEIGATGFGSLAMMVLGAVVLLAQSKVKPARVA